MHGQSTKVPPRITVRFRAIYSTWWYLGSILISKQMPLNCCGHNIFSLQLDVCMAENNKRSTTPLQPKQNLYISFSAVVSVVETVSLIYCCPLRICMHHAVPGSAESGSRMTVSLMSISLPPHPYAIPLHQPVCCLSYTTPHFDLSLTNRGSSQIQSNDVGAAVNLISLKAIPHDPTLIELLF